MFDEVLLEAGQLEVMAGPRGSMVISSDTENYRWQHPKDRRRDGNFTISARISDANPDDPFTVLIASPSEIRWSPTWMPLQAELPKRADWIQFVEGRPSDSTRTLAAELTKRSSGWGTGFPSPSFTESLVIKHANEDLAIASTSGVAVAMDRTHAPVIGRHLANGIARLDANLLVLKTIVPTVEALPWTTIADLRRSSAVRAWRSSLYEISEEIRDQLVMGTDVSALITRRYIEQVDRANRRAQAAFSSFLPTGIGLVTGIMSAIAFQLAGVGGAVAPSLDGPALLGTAAGIAADAISRRPQRLWLAGEATILDATR
ncbi:MAG: hypothetical protein R3B59_02390 [Dehalococcoidia bacterium]